MATQLSCLNLATGAGHGRTNTYQDIDPVVSIPDRSYPERCTGRRKVAAGGGFCAFRQQNNLSGFMASYEQNEAHDWLGDAAENYVRYVLSKEGFIVFAGSKWGADCAAHHKDDLKRWWRIEVRSTDKKNGLPLLKPKEKLKKIATVVADVKFNKQDGGHGMTITLYPVHPDGSYRKKYKDGAEVVMRRKGKYVQFEIEQNGDRCNLHDYLKKIA